MLNMRYVARQSFINPLQVKQYVKQQLLNTKRHTVQIIIIITKRPRKYLPTDADELRSFSKAIT